MLPKETIIVAQKFLYCIFERTLGVQNIHDIGISYVNKKDDESKIHK